MIDQLEEPRKPVVKKRDGRCTIVLHESRRLSPDEIVVMLEKWDAFAWRLALKYRYRNHRWGSEEEFHLAVQEGFFQAALRFDTSRKLSFGTYGAWWARQSVQRFLDAQRGIKTHHRTDPKYVRTRDLIDNIQSLDARVAGDIPQREPDAEPSFPDDFWTRVVKFLDKRLRDIIELRYRKMLTRKQVGENLGITRERVRQLEEKALSRIDKTVDFTDCLYGVG